MKYNYSLEQKIKGEDLYGLSCRIPKPTEKQSKCSHSRFVYVDKSYEDWDGYTHHEYDYVEESALEDIPNTNNFRCSLCGYTRRY